MGPYISNYIMSEIALQKKFQERGDVLIHVFPKVVIDKEWVNLFKRLNSKLYFIDYNPGNIKSIRTLRKIFKAERIQIIHCHFGGWDMDSRLAAPLIPVVWHQRMYVNLDTNKRKILYWLKYNLLGIYKTYNIAISKAVYDSISSLTNKHVFYIPDGIDFSRLSLNQSGQNCYGESPYRVLLFGYSPWVKGLDIAYKAIQILINQGISIELHVVSQSESDRYIANHYSPLPIWLKVLKPSDHVSDFFDHCDVFLSASRSEGFSNALLEAIYSGCPTVYSNIPGTQWASSFEHTFKYDVESPVSLAEAIIQCLNSPISNEEIERNREKALAQYSMDSWVEIVYNTLLSIRTGKR